MAESILDKVLFSIEEAELASLVWGFVDGGLARDDALALARAVAPGENAEDLIEDLIDRALLVETPAGDFLRSRFAEGIRLLARLRQLFGRQPWFSEPRLVSDFRVDLRRRRYPDRCRPPGAVLDELAAAGLSALQRDVWEALTTRRGKPLDLAHFQEEACRNLLLPSAAGTSAMIVTAGTGSGKTLAFYLPAFLQLVEAIQAQQHWVKALAIYPRTELLRDQLAECMLMADRIAPTLRRHGRRPLTIGALYQSTPFDSTERSLKQAGWRQLRNDDWVCPYMSCPDTGRDLVWTAEDIRANRHRLVRRGTGEQVTGNGAMILTRDRLQAEPPDILFSTVEMLNRRISDTWSRHLFGIGVPAQRRPWLMLLDEVHTYAGTSGAHSALVLRRWQHALGSAVTFVGLSATLLDAATFMSDLTGVDAGHVTHVEPLPQHMIEEGAEYQVVLRGDPAARTSLLSTSIQALMLLGRLMDGPDQKSAGRIGERVFAFTDDLDVINRLYDNLRDAEAHDIFGRPDLARNPLAGLRRGGNADDNRREADGQRWRVCELIGRLLDRRLAIARTTSQDRGVDQRADIIVASAALEVGFNDPRVGAVVQHKAPLDFAAFLQRKGRAGRPREMRPWTVTVMSDYGRDRLTYQNYELLFDPCLPARRLPLQNPYLLRMQACLSLIDWLSLRKPSNVKVSAWSALSSPKGAEGNPRFKKYVLAKLSKVFDPNTLEHRDLRSHLALALRLDEDTVDELLWAPPRSLMLEAIPTLLRRLYREWSLAFPSGPDRNLDTVTDIPLPEFIPANLFSDLNLPEVTIAIPPPQANAEGREETMSLTQAMNQMVPGRVTRRFAPERGGLNHWIPIDPHAQEQSIPLALYAPRTEYVATVVDGSDTFPVFRPWRIELQKLTSSVIRPTSNARLDWSARFEASGSPALVSPSDRSRWVEIVAGLGFHLNAHGAQVRVTRYARSATAQILLASGERTVSSVRFEEDGKRVAVGFEMPVDGIRIALTLPTAEDLAASELPDGLLAVTRTSYFRYRVLVHPGLPAAITTLERSWLQQIYAAAVIQVAVTLGIPPVEANNRLASDPSLIRPVFDALFTVQDVTTDSVEDEVDTDGEEDGSAAAERRHGRLTVRLMALMDEATVIEALHDAFAKAYEPAGLEWGHWLRRRLHETLSEAFLLACQQLAGPRAGADALIVDQEPTPPDGLVLVWITEKTVGGAGILETLAAQVSADPRSLFLAVEGALQPIDVEHVAHGLDRFVELASTDAGLAAIVARTRATARHGDRSARLAELYAALRARQLPISHSLSAALNARLLRAGMTDADDRLLWEIVTWRRELESRLGFAIDLRLMAYLTVNDQRFASRCAQMCRQPPGGPDLLMNALCGVLWSDSGEARQRALASYNPFRLSPPTDPELVRSMLLAEEVTTVCVDDDDWLTRAKRVLADGGRCRLVADRSQAVTLRAALTAILAEAVDVAFLQFYPLVERVEPLNGGSAVILSLSEEW